MNRPELSNDLRKQAERAFTLSEKKLLHEAADVIDDLREECETYLKRAKTAEDDLAAMTARAQQVREREIDDMQSWHETDSTVRWFGRMIDEILQGDEGQGQA